MSYTADRASALMDYSVKKWGAPYFGFVGETCAAVEAFEAEFNVEVTNMTEIEGKLYITFNDDNYDYEWDDKCEKWVFTRYQNKEQKDIEHDDLIMTYALMYSEAKTGKTSDTDSIKEYFEFIKQAENLTGKRFTSVSYETITDRLKLDVAINKIFSLNNATHALKAQIQEYIRLCENFKQEQPWIKDHSTLDIVCEKLKQIQEQLKNY